jgi:aminoglycoside phosphotransferase (APT) family kinase protein
MPNSTSPRIGYGAEVFYNTGSGFVQINKVMDIKVPSPEVAKIKATNLLSPFYVEEFIPGLINHSVLSFEWQYDEADYAAIVAVTYARTICTFKIVAAVTEETWGFSGFFTKNETTFKTEDLVTVKTEVELTGGADMTYTPGS